MLGLGRDILRLVSTGVTGGGGGPALGYTPPLDSIDSVAAYSVRKMRTDYSGACIEAYRVSDGATQDIGFDGDGLINTADIISFASGSQVLVRTWYNQGTSGPDAVALVTEYPEIYDGTSIRMMNGRPCLFPQNTAVGFTDIPINISDLQPLPWTRWTAFSVSKANTNLGVFALFNQSPNVRVNLVTPFVPTSNDGALQGIAIDTTGTGGIYYQGVDKGSFTTRETTLDQFLNFQTISNIVGLETNGSQSTYNDMTLGGTSFFAGYAMHIMQEVVIIPSLSQPSYDQALDVNANQYYQVTNLPDYTSGFLADYPDAAAAYSVRKLSNTAIKCMRVRRAVAPFDEKDIGFTAGGDLDEAAIVAFGGSDVLTVSAWYDQSGQSNHATQITPGSQPQIYDGVAVITENGKPAIDFQVDRKVLNAGSVLDVSSRDIFQWSVYSLQTGAFWTPIINGPLYSSHNQNTYQPRIFVQRVSAQFFGDASSGLTIDQMYLRHDYADTSNARTYLDGDSTPVIDLVDNNSDWSTGDLSIGTIGTTPDTYMKVSEVLLWQTGAGTVPSNRTGIETNVNNYYEIIVNDEVATSGFLFDYPNAAVAYSVRQLNNNAEFSMQVERSDGRTLNIGFDSNGDLDTQAIIDFSGGNAVRVNRFYDQTGAQNHSVDLAGTTRNIFIYDGTSIITENGMPMARYSLSSTGTFGNITIANNPLPQGLTHSVYAVGQRPSAPNAVGIFMGDGTPSITALYQERSGNLTYGPGWTSYGIYTYPRIWNAQRLYAYIRKNGTDGECFNDGVSRGTTSAMVATDQVRLTGWTMTKSNTGVEEDCSGLQELIYYNDDRTSVGDNTNILSNITTYFSIP